MMEGEGEEEGKSRRGRGEGERKGGRKEGEGQYTDNSTCSLCLKCCSLFTRSCYILHHSGKTKITMAMPR